MSQKKIPVGISACLLGDAVRYNGGHKRSRTCLNVLARVFCYQGFCPEVAIGLGVPREAIRLVGDDSPEAPRVVGTKTPHLDVTEALYAYGEKIGKTSLDFSGYVLMKNSPSCGLYSAKVYNGESPLPGKHQGMFVRGLLAVNPLLPVEEEARLNDPVLRENFVAAVYAYHDWRVNFLPTASPKALVAFHSKYKFLIMAHGQKAYKTLGRMVAEAGNPEFERRAQQYIEYFMTAISKPASRKGHVNTLYHILGYLKGGVAGDVRADIAEVIAAYRQGLVNLSVPSTMLNHYLKRYGDSYINEQAYLHPYSEELGLRNAI